MKNNFDKKHYDEILRDRTHLTDYEKDQLILEIKYRLEAFKEHFENIVKICDIQKERPAFTTNLNSIINPNGLLNVNDVGDNIKDLSTKFFNDIKTQAQIQNIDEINKILNKYIDIKDIKTLAMFFTEINLLCSSLLALKNKLFLFKIDGYPIFTELQTKQQIATQPQQYYVTIEPFQIEIDNIISIAASTSKTIHGWHKQNIELKSQYLNLYTQRLSIESNNKVLYIQITAIVLAIVLSAFFLFANDPFNLIKKNKELEKEMTILQKENVTLKEEVNTARDVISKNKENLTTNSSEINLPSNDVELRR